MDIKFDYDKYFKDIGLKILAKEINKYLEANFPTEKNRNILEYLFDTFSEFRKKTIIYRAIKEKTFPKYLRNKFVGGCCTLEDINEFIKKRYNKGYKYILISNEPVEVFDLGNFVIFINEKYGNYINDRYKDEKEVVFKFKKGNEWFKIKNIKQLK